MAGLDDVYDSRDQLELDGFVILEVADNVIDESETCLGELHAPHKEPDPGVFGTDLSDFFELQRMNQNAETKVVCDERFEVVDKVLLNHSQGLRTPLFETLDEDGVTVSRHGEFLGQWSDCAEQFGARRKTLDGLDHADGAQKVCGYEQEVGSDGIDDFCRYRSVLLPEIYQYLDHVAPEGVDTQFSEHERASFASERTCESDQHLLVKGAQEGLDKIISEFIHTQIRETSRTEHSDSDLVQLDRVAESSNFSDFVLQNARAVTGGGELEQTRRIEHWR